MLDIKVTTEDGKVHSRVTPERLSELVHRIGQKGDRFLVVERVPEVPNVFIQVYYSGNLYGLEVRERPGPGGLVGTELADPDAVTAAMTGWIRAEPDWDRGLEWKPVDLGSGQQ
jgi:hypothetical protein